jgi:spore maturation protein SpmA
MEVGTEPMEPSTITLSASAAIIPLFARLLRPIFRFMFRDRPSTKSWNGQRLEAMRNAGCEIQDIFFAP